MTDRHVRRARPDDVPALVRLRALMFEAMGVPADDQAWQESAGRWFHERLDHTDHRVVVVEDAATEVVIACAMGAIRDAAPSPTVPDGRDVLISNVCTDPGFRGRGHARAAFTAVLDWARDTGIERAELLATDQGRAMYARAGFTTSAHPVMRARLSEAG